MLTAPLFAVPGGHAPHAAIPSMAQLGGDASHVLAMSMQRRLPHPQSAQPQSHYAPHAPRLPQPHLGVSQPPPLPQPLPVPRASTPLSQKREKLPSSIEPQRPPRTTAALFTAPPASLTAAERRRMRGALLAQKRARRWGTPPTAGMNSELLRVCKAKISADGANAAATVLDKKTARVIRNREVALRARQKAKDK
eukprot:IDg19122t1